MTTVSELRRMADVREHFERGGKIEFHDRTTNSPWLPVGVAGDNNYTSLAWQFFDYRIAPEPKKARECWRFQYADGRLSGLAYPAEDQCRDSYEGAGRPVRFVEAMEDSQ